MYEKKCVVCGIKFNSSYQRTKYCSTHCKSKGDYQRRIEYHKAHWKKYSLKNREKLNQRNAEWYREHKLLARSINKKATLKYKDNTRFGGKREIILKLHKNSCDFCKTTKNLHIHHIDGKSYWNGKPNNDLKNLMVLCGTCHKKLHWMLTRVKTKSDTPSNGR
jgi:hypothetical protein